MLQQSGLPSDHAPISLTISCTGVNLNYVLERAGDLGNYSVTQCLAAHRKLSRRLVRFPDINRQRFETVVADINIDTGVDDDIHGLATVISNELHRCAVLSKNNDENIEVRSDHLSYSHIYLRLPIDRGV